jgi:hypothetical protein
MRDGPGNGVFEIPESNNSWCGSSYRWKFMMCCVVEMALENHHTPNHGRNSCYFLAIWWRGGGRAWGSEIWTMMIVENMGLRWRAATVEIAVQTM